MEWERRTFAMGWALVSSPVPYTPKPSILDRILGRLIPTDQYGSLLDPVDRRAIQKQGLLQLGAGILSQSGAESGLPAIGRAIQGLDVPGMAEHALRIKAYQQSLHDQAVVHQALANHPQQPGQSMNAWLQEVTPQILSLPGGEQIVTRIASLLDATKEPRGAAERARWSFQTVMENGEPVLYRINEDTGTKYRVGLGKPSGGIGGGGVMAQETKAAARNALSALNQADAVLVRDPQADIYPVASAIAEGAGTIPIIGGALKGAMGPAAQRAMRPTQQEFQQAMDQFLHNYSALLPRGGRSVQILKNLRASFAPSAGQETPEVRRSFAEARQHLRETLQALAEGREPTGALPGAEDVPTGAPAPGGSKARYPDNEY